MKDFLIQNYDKLIGGFVGFTAIVWLWFKAIQKTKSDLKIARIRKDEIVANLSVLLLRQNPEASKNKDFGNFLEQNSEVQKVKAEIEHLESINKVLTFWRTKK